MQRQAKFYVSDLLYLKKKKTFMEVSGMNALQQTALPASAVPVTCSAISLSMPLAV
jgi:hypothetical protein